MDGVVVISGGGTGIGAAIARAVAEDGGHALIIGRRDDKLRITADAIAADCGEGHASWAQADLSVPEEVERLAATVRESHGTILGIVNNAGGDSQDPGESFVELKDYWQRTYDQNVVTAVLLTAALGPMLRRPGGRIVNIGSMAIKFGVGRPAYVAAKGALNAWTLSLGYQYAKDGIASNAVLPGYTPDTEFFGEGSKPTLPPGFAERFPFGRAGTPEDVSGIVRYLLSPEASYVTGQIIEVAGGVVPPGYS
jgi:3-oxoacyl-[acyl-carrier protein] reductase